MIVRGLPTHVGDPEWREWLLDFPSPPTGKGALGNYEQVLRAHFDLAPSVDSLSHLELRDLADDLASFCDDLQTSQQAAAEMGGIDFAVSLAGFVGVIFIPDAAILLAAIPLAAAIFGIARAFARRRTQGILEVIIAMLTSLSRTLRR